MFEKHFAFIRWPHSQDLPPHFAEVAENERSEVIPLIAGTWARKHPLSRWSS